MPIERRNMFKTYNCKMLNIYRNKISDFWRILTFNIWQKINHILLKTYPLIEDCARCNECGRNVHDFIVPNELWIMINGSEGGVLCYDCFCNKADEKTDFKWRMNLKEEWNK